CSLLAFLELTRAKSKWPRLYTGLTVTSPCFRKYSRVRSRIALFMANSFLLSCSSCPLALIPTNSPVLTGIWEDYENLRLRGRNVSSSGTIPQSLVPTSLNEGGRFAVARLRY